MYLGYLGLQDRERAGREDIAPPQELFEIEPTKIVGLTIDPNRLSEIRSARVRSMGATKRRYAELEGIYDELEQAAKLHRRLRLPGARRLRALGRGDGDADRAPRRPAAAEAAVP